jgi:maltooligosyltrehalose trehalohydrolase
VIAAERFGPRFEPAAGVTFRLWAPAASRVDLVLAGTHKMQAGADGWFVLTVPQADPGTRYKFRIDGEIDVPDPASRFQPADVHGPSEVVDPDYAWRSQSWRGRPWHEAVILELHVGAFSPAGTFRSAIEKLDHLVETGITVIELMPVADFAGRWNWGYDGVYPFAPDSTYGRPEDLKALVDAAHERGLMVLLDVVYNHFGPEGNYLARYAPAFFTNAHRTPWGDAIDFTVPQVRAFMIESALHWLERYCFDGLRLDAVHAIFEPGRGLLLDELSRAVGKLAAASGRSIHLVLENDDNQAALLDPAADPPQGRFRAQWNDDYHHAWHVLLTGESFGYYGDYCADPAHCLRRTLACGFAYQGEPSPYRNGRSRGEASGHLPPTAFVSFLQNHDQIGNRPHGDRLVAVVPEPALVAALTVTLLAPMPPLLFMGEEWGASEPFAFFCDFAGELADAVRRGRKAEFAAAFKGVALIELPDPISEQTFRSAALDWAARERTRHRDRLDLVRGLLAARRQHVIPRLARAIRFDRQAAWNGSVMAAQWVLGDGARLQLVANLTGSAAPRPAGTNAGISIWGGPPPSRLPPWSAYWAMSEA